ncbi:MAG: flagellar biosynthesis protein FliQ [Clostridiales bacterium]|jgi:flagellar biosynthetic protein FliQ|nr:flagellar biosynthesis protein FliQ [Clostridiales bacterium]
MEQETIVAVMQNAIWTVILVAMPPLIMGLVVGVTVSLFQTITSIQEATLAFVPKIVAVFLALMIFGNWMLTLLVDFTTTLFEEIPNHIRS